MSLNFLQLNSNKTEVITFSPDQLAGENTTYSLAASIKTAAKDLGVTFDSKTHFKTHTNEMLLPSRNISKNKSVLSLPDIEKITHASVFPAWTIPMHFKHALVKPQ